jgi:ATP-binding cassette subfamily C protein
LIAIVTGLFRVVRGFAMLEVQGQMDATIQAAIWDRILNLPPSFFRKYSSGELGVRAMGITEIRRLLSGHIMNAILNSLSAIFNLALLFLYRLNWPGGFSSLGPSDYLSGFYQLHYQREKAVQREISGKVLRSAGSQAPGQRFRAARWLFGASVSRSSANWRILRASPIVAGFQCGYPPWHH